MITKRQKHTLDLKRATKVAWRSLAILIALTTLKAIGGHITNIITLSGDAIGSFSDIIAIVAIILGLKFSQKKPSVKFRYGFHRVETFVSLLISVFIIYAGCKIFSESVNRFFIEPETGAHIIGMVIAAVSVATSLFAFFYQRKTGMQVNSTALLASAYDKRNDAFVSMGVLGSVVADKFGIPYIEGAIGVLLAVIIIWTGFKYGKDALLYLLDYWDNPQVTKQIKEILERSRIVTAVKNIRLRHVGTYIFGEAFLSVNPFTNSKDLRDEIHRLDKKVEESVEHLGDLVLYIDPPTPQRIGVAIPVIDENGLDSRIAENPEQQFKFLFAEIRAGKIKKYYIENKILRIDQISEIAKFLAEHRTNILVSSMIGPLLYYNLRLKNIKVYPHFLDVKDVKNTLKLLMLDI